MKGRRHTPEQVVRKLREADRLLGEVTGPRPSDHAGLPRRCAKSKRQRYELSQMPSLSARSDAGLGAAGSG